jgi:hypothetical protein
MGQSTPLRSRLCIVAGSNISRRQDLIERMATDITADPLAITSEREAVRALTGRYPFYDVALHAEDARFEAQHRLVMREMGQR